MSGKPSRSLTSVKAARPGGGGKPWRNARPNGRRAGPGRVPSGDGRVRDTGAGKGAGAKPARTSRVVVRRIDPVAVFKVSALFYVSLCIALFTAGLLLWAGAHAIGLVDNVESFMDEIGFTDFRLDGGRMFQGFLVLGVALVVVGSIANLLMAVLYNLIGDVVGGIKVVLSEDRTQPRR